jgi:hypothetical protein
MAFLVALLTLALIAVVVLVVGAPLRRADRLDHSRRVANSASVDDGQPRSAASTNQEHDLQAAREAKYREIRDAELDFRTGKLSREDYDAIDADLRAEALDILNRLDPSAKPSGPDPSAKPSGPSAGDAPGAGEEADV